MKNKTSWPLLLLLAAWPSSVPAQIAGFGYQGRLLDRGAPANGIYDLRFALSDDDREGDYVGQAITNAAVSVSNGLFNVMLDFGTAAFDGSPRWLEIGVRTNGSGAPFVLLSSRQPVGATPYAIFAASAVSATVASNLVAGATLVGNGAGLTNLNGAGIQPFTIGTNQIDPALDAAYRGGGIATLNGNGTNTSIYQALTLVGETEAVFSVVNEETIIPQSDTNRILVTGADTAAANGVYRFAGISGVAVQVYTNDSHCGLVFDFREETEISLDAPIYISNSVGAVYLDGAQLGLRGYWNLGPAGQLPVPLATFGATTNHNPALSISNVLPLGRAISTNVLYVNNQIGDDSSAQIGRPDRPWANLDAAVVSVTENSTIQVAGGVYYVTNEVLIRGNGISLVGAGRKLTRIYKHYPDPRSDRSVWIGANAVLKDFSTDMSIGIVGTNTLVSGVESIGVVDDLLVYAGGVTVENSSFGSGYDSAVIDPGPGLPVRILNCSFESKWDGTSPDCRGIAVKSGACEIIGGRIKVANYSSPVCLETTDDQPGISVTLNNVAFEYATTNGTAWAVSNRNNAASIVLQSGSIPRSAVRGNLDYAPGSFGNGLTTNVTISGATFYITNGVILKVE